MSEVALPGEGRMVVRERWQRDLVQNDSDGRMRISVDGKAIETICNRLCITVVSLFLMIFLFILILKYY